MNGSANINNTTDNIWVWVMQDMQTNAAQYTATDVLALLGVNDTVKLFRNLENTMRFKFLWQKRYHFNSNYSGLDLTDTAGEQRVIIRGHISTDIIVDFAGTAGLTTEQRSNSIWLCAGSSNAKCVCTTSARIRYEDLNR